ncbi:cardiolipin synthase [Luteimonas vadosa]|uniref:Cardiolipin synthase n=1 Tax=Luteimonas vadosa TaxID=1165507 RepID=A0ABP9DQE9_9GAMM
MPDWLQHAWSSFTAIDNLGAWLAMGWLAYLVGLGGWIILQKREPVATISWLLGLAALPYVGFLIYFFFGPQRIQRKQLRRQKAKESLMAPERDRSNQEVIELGRLGQAVCKLPTSRATRVELLVDGAKKYDRLVEAIGQARHHVHMEYYIYAPDQTGDRVLEALAERARAGVKVRLLLDAMGSIKVTKAYLKPLLDAGGEFCWFHPTKPWTISRPWINLRSHRKIAVMDGKIGFAGGINITDDENEEVSDEAFRDLHMRIEGDVVDSLQLVFLEDWAYATGDPAPTGPELFPDGPEGDIPAQVLASGPDSNWEAIHRLQVATIYAASERVWLVTPYFVPGEAAMMALTSAALAGLDVRLLIPKKSDSRMVTQAARSYFDELMEAGIKVYEYGPRMLHTKALLVDDSTCILGSANFDHRSFRLNFEVAVLIDDKATARELAQLIEHEIANSVRVQDGRRSFWRHRLPEALARLFSPML